MGCDETKVYAKWGNSQGLYKKYETIIHNQAKEKPGTWPGGGYLEDFAQ